MGVVSVGVDGELHVVGVTSEGVREALSKEVVEWSESRRGGRRGVLGSLIFVFVVV